MLLPVCLATLSALGAGAAAVGAANVAGPCAAGSPHASTPFCDTSRSFEDRAADLVSRIPAAVKNGGLLSTTSDGVEALGIASYEWWSEGLHGIRCGHGITCNASGATSFPQVIGSGAAFNRSLWHAIGDAISTEVRAFYNAGRGHLSIFAPNINIFRDARWGRGQETPGECPYLTSQYALQYVRGMQGNPAQGNGYLKTMSTCKHFAGFSLGTTLGLNGKMTQAQTFNALISDQDLADTELPAFRTCILEAKGASVMCSYNAINGQPSCGNSWLLTDVLRSEWEFSGHVVSDCGGVSDLASPRFPKRKECLAAQMPQFVNQTSADCWCNDTDCDGFPTVGDASTAATAIRAGTDLDCGRTFQGHIPSVSDDGKACEPLPCGSAHPNRTYCPNLPDPDQCTKLPAPCPPGPCTKVSAREIETALTRLFLNRMKTGEFDPPERQPYRQIPTSAVNSKAHQDLALEAARQGLTLLKNQQEAGNVDVAAAGGAAGGHLGGGSSSQASLPWSVSAVKSVAVIGPNANCTEQVCPHGPHGDCHCSQLGNYATSSPFVISPMAGIGAFASVSGCKGSAISTCGVPTATDKGQFALAVSQAASMDATVLVMGMVVDRQRPWTAGCVHRPGSEGEGNDRPHGNAIPAIQLQLVDAVATATAKAKKPLSVVVMAGGTLDLSPWLADARIGSLIWVGYPGMMGGQALAEVLFGKVSPSGRLPYSILRDADVQGLNAMRMDMRPNATEGYPGRSYRFSTATPVFRFGFGLSFTSFELNWIGSSVDRALSLSCATHLRHDVERFLETLGGPRAQLLAKSAGRTLAHHRVNVTNTGTVASSTSVLAFSSPPGAGTDGHPLEQLFDFKKVDLQPGETAEIFFAMAARDLTLVNAIGVREAGYGEWTVRVGVEGDAHVPPITTRVCV